MKRFNKIFFAAVAAAAIFSFPSCTSEPTWGVGGTIEGAKDGNVILEAMNEGGYWYALDTLKINADGAFEGEGTPTPSPTIYRLNYNGRYIYFILEARDLQFLLPLLQSHNPQCSRHDPQFFPDC